MKKRREKKAFRTQLVNLVLSDYLVTKWYELQHFRSCESFERHLDGWRWNKNQKMTWKSDLHLLYARTPKYHVLRIHLRTHPVISETRESSVLIIYYDVSDNYYYSTHARRLYYNKRMCIRTRNNKRTISCRRPEACT